MALVLGIESSCDETAVAVVRDGYDVLSNSVASQIAKHAAHGGVVPELAAREHLTALIPTLQEALSNARVTLSDIDAIAVTQGPGLIPALLVGLSFAKGLALGNNIAYVGVNHFIGHIYGAFLDEANRALEDKASYPLLALVVSGGHTSLMLIDEHGQSTALGYTIDDAAGEALDKGAKLLNLGYPGGPVMQKTAEGGDPHRFEFPRPLTGAAGKPLAEENRYNFSFSGIKTALLYHVKKYADSEGRLPESLLKDTVASYQEAVVDVLTRKTLAAAKDTNAKTIVVAGGVACNSVLRERFEKLTPPGVRLRLAPRKYCTDNAAMIGGVGYHYWKRGEFSTFDIDSYARLPQITRIPFLA
ncbi:MAG: tRNA (adenosine(37)-N6)-threonylcarbamoyltransferase complex transferase subunit TsaD [Victivallales bacterium]|jgi:N6-L-threonylcarbamoyladenine synthase|nr:tRNA (adenosine(37)-N6)-threonylcarbamoyltransferase complex transferase subunit TsaD [Victivallales bacterium]